MRKRKYLKSILARLNKKRTMSKNPFNWPPSINVTGWNINKLRRSGRFLKTLYIDYNKKRMSKGKGKLKKKREWLIDTI